MGLWNVTGWTTTGIVACIYAHNATTHLAASSWSMDSYSETLGADAQQCQSFSWLRGMTPWHSQSPVCVIGYC
jgi:hypothetical protein